MLYASNRCLTSISALHIFLRPNLGRPYKNALGILELVVDCCSAKLDNRTGIPIGNLTSQIFSNIYLHEFDRFVRQYIKPLAYIRYGDDFSIFCPTRLSAYKNRVLATSFLSNSLSLTINPKNDILVSSVSGLKFLGHSITKDFAVVDKHTTKSVLNKLDWHNVASYKALPLSEADKNSLDWILLEKYELLT